MTPDGEIEKHEGIRSDVPSLRRLTLCRSSKHPQHETEEAQFSDMTSRNSQPQRVIRFPAPETADPATGLLAVGADFGVDVLREAYRNGVFPWPMAIDEYSIEEAPPLWFCPPRRGVLFFEDLHIPKSLEKVRRKTQLRFTIDQAFSEVISHCASQPRPGQDGTWITEPLKESYLDFHRAGDAHSIEAWNGEKLVAGLYGVESHGVFSAESMFHLEPNASKLVVLELINTLKKKGADWVDIQVVTPHMKLLGAKELTRKRYLKLLQETHARGLQLFSSS